MGGGRKASFLCDMATTVQRQPPTYPTMGQQGILDWLNAASFIIYDAMNAKALYDRLNHHDDATRAFWLNSLGNTMWQQQWNIMITEMDKLYWPCSSQELTIQGVIAQMRVERNQPWLKDAFTKLRVFKPVSKDVNELFSKLDLLDIEVAKGKDIYKAINIERNNVTAHTRAPHRASVPEVPPVELWQQDLAYLIDLGLRVHNTISQDIGGRAYLFGTDVARLDELIRMHAERFPERVIDSSGTNEVRS